MLSRQKEAVKNELLTLKEAGLVDDYTVRKVLSSAVPDAFRQGYGMQEACARRMLQHVLRNKPVQPQSPQPWEDPAVFLGVIEEFLLSSRYEQMDAEEKGAVMQLWQAYMLARQQREMQQAQATAQPNAAPGTSSRPGAQPIGAPGGEHLSKGAEELAQKAQSEVSPPAGFGDPKRAS